MMKLSRQGKSLKSDIGRVSLAGMVITLGIVYGDLN
jgi:hypothetical protein